MKHPAGVGSGCCSHFVLGLRLAQGEGGGKPTFSVSEVGTALFGALALQDVTSSCVLPELLNSWRGLG